MELNPITMPTIINEGTSYEYASLNSWKEWKKLEILNQDQNVIFIREIIG